MSPSEGPKDSWDSAPWTKPEPGRLVGRGHAAGDLLEAHAWDVLESREGYLRVRAHLPARLKNPQGQLFGGFTPTYVDFLAIHTWWAGRPATPGHPWLATLNMRLDYFEPITSEHFEMSGRVLNQRGSLSWLECQFFDPEGILAAHALITLKAI